MLRVIMDQMASVAEPRPGDEGDRGCRVAEGAAPPWEIWVLEQQGEGVSDVVVQEGRLAPQPLDDPRQVKAVVH